MCLACSFSACLQIPAIITAEKIQCFSLGQLFLLFIKSLKCGVVKRRKKSQVENRWIFATLGSPGLKTAWVQVTIVLLLSCSTMAQFTQPAFFWPPLPSVPPTHMHYSLKSTSLCACLKPIKRENMPSCSHNESWDLSGRSERFAVAKRLATQQTSMEKRSTAWMHSQRGKS